MTIIHTDCFVMINGQGWVLSEWIVTSVGTLGGNIRVGNVRLGNVPTTDSWWYYYLDIWYVTPSNHLGILLKIKGRNQRDLSHMDYWITSAVDTHYNKMIYLMNFILIKVCFLITSMIRQFLS